MVASCMIIHLCIPQDTTYVQADPGCQRLVRNVCGWNIDCGFLQNLNHYLFIFMIAVTTTKVKLLILIRLW